MGLSLGAGGVSSGYFDKHQCSCDRSNNSETFPPDEFQQSGNENKRVQFVVQGYSSCEDITKRSVARPVYPYYSSLHYAVGSNKKNDNLMLKLLFLRNTQCICHVIFNCVICFFWAAQAI